VEGLKAGLLLWFVVDFPQKRLFQWKSIADAAIALNANFSKPSNLRNNEKNIFMKTTPEQRVKDYIEKTGTTDAERIRLAMKRKSEGSVPMSVIRAVLVGQPVPEGKPVAPSAAKPRFKKITREQFAKQFDSKTRTREAIVAGLKRIGPEELVPDHLFRSEYCRDALTSQWRAVASESEFFEYQVKADGKIHWAQPDTISWALENVQGAKEPY
jgi:hypothetical protein